MTVILTSVSEAELVGALDALDVPFLAGGRSGVQLTPIELMVQLARASEARLRSAIIPLLLRHPESANDARTIEQALSDLPRITFICFYTAATILQRQYSDRLTRLFGAQMTLPDWFSVSLGVMLSIDADANLRALGECQSALTGLTINWVGTYRHAAERFIKHYEVERRWNLDRV